MADGIRPGDADIFSKAAAWFKVYILVRATNPASLPYMDLAGYSAKRLDCKAKTADRDVLIGGRFRRTAGLVVDPTIVGAAAYDGAKYGKALTEWGKFKLLLASDIHDASGKPNKTYFPGGKFYAVQHDPDSKHCGCVMFSSSSLVSAASYIHGDYDLYAIVPADSAADTVFVTEERLGEKHVRSKELTDIQTFVNSRLGRPMVLHGDQEKYSDHSDEEVYAFDPDGRTVTVLDGEAAIRAYYATTLKGRKTGGKHATLEPAGGLWQRVR